MPKILMLASDSHSSSKDIVSGVGTRVGVEVGAGVKVGGTGVLVGIAVDVAVAVGVGAGWNAAHPALLPISQKMIVKSTGKAVFTCIATSLRYGIWMQLNSKGSPILASCPQVFNKLSWYKFSIIFELVGR
jgi:hypothetical protein